jgi:hypothetical protein
MSNKSEDWKSSLDRFGDDLTEVILSYLPISDKIRLECTSKQVQSLIFNKQKSLHINQYPNEWYLNQLLLSGSTSDDRKQVNYEVFGAVLKKFKFLDTIRIEGNITVDSDLIQTIADNCRPLKTLWIYDRFSCELQVNQNITDECLMSLAQKCGSSLQSLRINNLPQKQFKQFLYSLPELRSLTLFDIQSVITEESNFEESFRNSEELPKFLPKLQEIGFSVE